MGLASKKSKESLASKNAAKVIHKSGLVGMLLWVPLKMRNLLSVVPLPHMQCDSCCMLDTIIANVCLVAQSYLTLGEPMDYSLPGSSVHGDSPGKLGWVGWDGLPCLPPGDFPNPGIDQVSHIAGGFFTL